MASSALGDFLRSRRAATRPRDVGLPEHGLRRVQGLRREEVAVVAALSADYYTRLEQGRELHPSPQILDALARTFDLDDDAHRHLFSLADLVFPLTSNSDREAVDPELMQLMDGWPQTPALVFNRTLDLLACNALAQELYSGFADPDNLARMTFLDPEGARFFADWGRAAQTVVANLRMSAGRDLADPRLRSLVGELGSGSPHFRELWKQQHVRGKTREAKGMQHADVGALTLTYHTFDVRAAPGQQLLVYQAAPGSSSADGLALLGSLAATRLRTGSPRAGRRR